jgi:hypothetical protein
MSPEWTGDDKQQAAIAGFAAGVSSPNWTLNAAARRASFLLARDTPANSSQASGDAHSGGAVFRVVAGFVS